MRKFLLAVLVIANSTAAEKVVVIGDSLSCGPFGIQLVRNLTNSGYQVSLYCAVSSTPLHWLTGKVPPASDGCHRLTSSEVQQMGDLCPNPFTPTRVATHVAGTCMRRMPTLTQIMTYEGNARYVVALGANSVGGGAQIETSYALMARRLPGCTWIGPPHFRPDQTNPRVFSVAAVTRDENNLDAFVTSLSPAINSCVFIDSRPLTLLGQPPPVDADETVDGVHRTNCAGKIWADEIRL